MNGSKETMMKTEESYVDGGTVVDGWLCKALPRTVKGSVEKCSVDTGTMVDGRFQESFA